MKLYVTALAVLTGMSAIPVLAGELPEGPHIVVSGTASVDAVPDIVTLTIGVNVEEKDALTAKKHADERVAQYVTFLEHNLIARKDIHSASLYTRPDYDYQNGKNVLKGYLAARTVEVTLRKPDKLSLLLDGALKAGLNEIRSVTPGVAQPDVYKNQARKAAINDALRQAEALASGFNRRPGPVYSIRYTVPDYPSYPAAQVERTDGAPVSAEETYGQAAIQFDAQVDVVFHLEPAAGQQPATPAGRNNQ